MRFDTCLQMSVSFSDMTKEISAWLANVGEIYKGLDSPAILLETLEVQITNLKVGFLHFFVINMILSRFQKQTFGH